MFAFLFLAQVAPPEGWGLAKALFDAVMSGQWFLAVSLALMGLVFFVRMLPWEPLKTDVGGVLLNFGTSLALAFFTAAAAGTPFGWPVVATALELSGGAAVAHMLLKKLVLPMLLKIPAVAKLWEFVSALFPLKGAVVAPVAAAPVAVVKSDEIANQ